MTNIITRVEEYQETIIREEENRQPSPWNLVYHHQTMWNMAELFLGTGNYRQISLRTGKLQATITEDWKITGNHH
jgi:hypothetical protein